MYSSMHISRFVCVSRYSYMHVLSNTCCCLEYIFTIYNNIYYKHILAYMIVYVHVYVNIFIHVHTLEHMFISDIFWHMYLDTYGHVHTLVSIHACA